MQLVDLLAEAGPDAVIDIDNALCRESMQVIGAPLMLQATAQNCSTHRCACECLCSARPNCCALSALHCCQLHGRCTFLRPSSTGRLLEVHQRLFRQRGCIKYVYSRTSTSMALPVLLAGWVGL